MQKELLISIPSDLLSAPIALGLSGGRDSMCLAHAFLQSGVEFFAVNFEHGIRGKSSVRDSDFVKKWCVDNGVKCICYSLDVPTYATENGLTVEQAARELRYNYFDKLLEEKKCSCVALAHHRDDLAETVLMRIIRGTGVRGLTAMTERSGGYFRPLINCSRLDIDNYVKENGIPYVDDETNADIKYTRNFIRAELRSIKEKFPSVDESLARLARNAAEAQSFIENSFSYFPEIKDDECYLDIDELINVDEVGKKLYVFRACEKLGVKQDIEERHFPIIFGLAKLENGKSIELPHDITVHKDGAYLVFARGNKQLFDGEISFSGESVKGVLICDKANGYDPAAPKGTLFVDRDKIPGGAVLRAPRECDKFVKFGGGTKNLGDFLTDKKIPLRKRKSLIVCATAEQGNPHEHEILFVLGVEIASSVKVDKNTKNVIKITEDKNEIRKRH